jgi:prophage DNA circulation protein
LEQLQQKHRETEEVRDKLRDANEDAKKQMQYQIQAQEDLQKQIAELKKKLADIGEIHSKEVIDLKN